MVRRTKQERKMDENERLDKKNWFSIGAYVILVAMALFLYFYTKKGGHSQLVFGCVLGGFLLAFWVVMDIVRPLVLHELDGKSEFGKRLFFQMAAAGFLGYVGLVFCVMKIKQSDNLGIVGAILFVLCQAYRRNARSDLERS